jgi:hypothetical protein
MKKKPVKTISIKQFLRYLEHLRACFLATEYVRGRDTVDRALGTDRRDWLMWLADHMILGRRKDAAAVAYVKGIGVIYRDWNRSAREDMGTREYDLRDEAREKLLMAEAHRYLTVERISIRVRKFLASRKRKG